MPKLPDRRSFIFSIAKAGGLAAVGPRLLAQAPADSTDIAKLLHDTLLRDHPRLHLRREQWTELSNSIAQDEFLKRWYDALQISAQKMLNEPPAEYKLTGPRLLYQSRAALRHISTLAALYRLDGDVKKADRARAELKAICSFPSWHPPHFLDVAEMTNAAALGYDWLYDVLPESERRMIRAKIIEFGLRPGLAEYERGVNWSKPNANNWGQVCAGGLTMGALAIAQDGGDDAGGIAPEPTAILTWTTDKVRNAMTSYAPDGGWPEGPGYWSYATQYTCYMLSGLNSALGMDFGLSEMKGFPETGTFRVASIGPSGKLFNYADAAADVNPAPEMFWLAKNFNRPLYAVSERQQITRTHPEIFHLIWSLPHESQLVANSLPLDLTYSRIDVAYFRTSWTDTDAFFVGFKGGSNRASHGHLDLGTFVMDALGERWALDLGPDDYDLPGYFGAERWEYYRLRSEGHNTLTIGTENQSLTAEAPMTDFSSTSERGFAMVDLTEAYSSAFIHVKRQMTLERRPDQRVVVTDIIESGSSSTVRWNMHTDARVTVSGNTALFELNGKRLRAVIESPGTASFSVMSTNVMPPQGQQPDVHNLVINYRVPAGSSEIKVVFERVPGRNA